MKRGLFVVILSLFVCGTGFAQLAAWNFGPGVKGNEKTSFSTLTDDCLEVSELSRGPGLVPQKATCSFASTWPACNSMLGAVRLGAYYQFSLNAKRGCVVSFDRLLVVLRVRPAAPDTYILTYSTDGEHFMDIGRPVHITATGNDGKLQAPIDLSGIPALQDVPAKITVTFRLYAWGGREGENTAFRIGKSTPGRDALAVYGTARRKR